MAGYVLDLDRALRLSISDSVTVRFFEYCISVLDKKWDCVLRIIVW